MAGGGEGGAVLADQQRARGARHGEGELEQAWDAGVHGAVILQQGRIGSVDHQASVAGQCASDAQ